MVPVGTGVPCSSTIPISVKAIPRGLRHGAVHRESVGYVDHREIQRPIAQHRSAAEVAICEGRVLPQALGEGGPSDNPGGALPFDQIQSCAGVESRHYQ